jgi:hypothetical protein
MTFHGCAHKSSHAWRSKQTKRELLQTAAIRIVGEEIVCGNENRSALRKPLATQHPARNTGRFYQTATGYERPKKENFEYVVVVLA